MPFLQGLQAVDIKSSPFDTSRPEGLRESLLIHKASPSTVYQKTAVFHGPKIVFIHHSPGFFRERNVQSHHIRKRESSLQIFTQGHSQAFRFLQRDIGIVSVKLHPESPGSFGHSSSDTPETYDKKAFSLQLHAHKALPLPLALKHGFTGPGNMP